MNELLMDFIPNLRCPQSGRRLQILEQSEIDKLNLQIAQNQLMKADGKPMEHPIRSALINEAREWIYPVLAHDIIILQKDAAISAKKAGNAESGSNIHQLAAEKKLVMDFYDRYGWQKSEGEAFNDTVDFEDRRTVAAAYWSRCHLRLNRYLEGGTYLLDVASGAIPNDEYMTFDDRYQIRVCADISLLALQEASARLNGQGIFIQADMTDLPLASGSMDAVISMHTVYHIPRQEQTRAVGEAYRVLKPSAKAVIIYSWNKSTLMNTVFRFWRKLLSLKKGKRKVSTKEKDKNSPSLFVNQQNYDWFHHEIRERYHARLEVYSAISRSFSHTFIRGKRFGTWLSNAIFFLEERFPSWLGKYGQYPVFLLQRQPDEITEPEKVLQKTSN